VKYPENRLFVQFDLGVDQFGRKVNKFIVHYVELLKRRGLNVSTVVALGSRAKGRGKPDSDVDLLVISTDLEKKGLLSSVKRHFLLSDMPICIGIEPSGCTKSEFLRRLANFDITALDAMYYGKIVYDDGFWSEVEKAFAKMKKECDFDQLHLMEGLLPI
jgi:predicted nucleotidyltransferase